MTTNRLEEIANWASKEQQEHWYQQDEQGAANMRDLARCARFVATVQKAHKPHHSRWGFSVEPYGVFLSNGHGCGHDTAIEAVEAAGSAA